MDEGQGAPVLLLHGFGGTNNLVRRLPAQIGFQKEHRFISVDCRGHGRSGKPHDPSQYGIQMVEDLVRLLDHLKIEKAHVVGGSMGGFIALKMVAMHPERLLSAVIGDAGWERATQENLEFAEAVAKAVEKEGTGPLLKRLGIADRPLTLWEELEGKIWLEYVNDPLALAAVARGSHQLSLTEEELLSNKVPTLIIIGSKDGFLPDAKALAEKMANHELVIVEGVGHGGTASSNVSRTALRDFLDKHTSSSGPPEWCLSNLWRPSKALPFVLECWRTSAYFLAKRKPSSERIKPCP